MKNTKKNQNGEISLFFIWELNNYFLAESPMTNPANFYGQVPQIFCSSYPGYWPLQPQNMVIVPQTQHFPSFNNQLGYQCILQPAPQIPTYQNVVGNVMISPGMAPVQNQISHHLKS